MRKNKLINEKNKIRIDTTIDKKMFTKNIIKYVLPLLDIYNLNTLPIEKVTVNRNHNRIYIYITSYDSNIDRIFTKNKYFDYYIDEEEPVYVFNANIIKSVIDCLKESRYDKIKDEYKKKIIDNCGYKPYKEFYYDYKGNEISKQEYMDKLKQILQIIEDIKTGILPISPNEIDTSKYPIQIKKYHPILQHLKPSNDSIFYDKEKENYKEALANYLGIDKSEIINEGYPAFDESNYETTYL